MKKLIYVAMMLLTVACLTTACKKEKKSSDTSSPSAKSDSTQVDSAKNDKETAKAKCLPDGQYFFDGSFDGKYPVAMEVAVKGERIFGTYWYKKYKTPIIITGLVSDKGIVLQEYAPDAGNSGDFVLKVSPEGNLEGIFTTHSNGKTLNFQATMDKNYQPQKSVDEMFMMVNELDYIGENGRTAFDEMEGVNIEGYDIEPMDIAPADVEMETVENMSLEF